VDSIRIGLLLSYSGQGAANSINSERALLMAIDEANAAGGVGRRPLELIARDTGSDGKVVTASAQELLDAQVAVFIGPDTPDLVAQVRPLLSERTVVLPSFNTSSDILFKPAHWFVMGPATARVACELVAQLEADDRKNPVVIVNPKNGYNSALTWELVRRKPMPKVTLPPDGPLSADSVPDLGEAADAYVLAALPASASALIFALTATEALQDGTRWYLSPTLHTPAFLETIPRGALDEARGVSPGTLSGGGFRARFAALWNDRPQDDAYLFYDAGAVVILALARAIRVDGAIPADPLGLAPHIRAVTTAGGKQVQWDELAQGLDLIETGTEVEYVGLAGGIQFDGSGQTAAGSTTWWTIDGGSFLERIRTSDCQQAASRSGS
jgi:ABC-type branched-subunit amino acid transport system substrate-binding protein